MKKVIYLFNQVNGMAYNHTQIGYPMIFVLFIVTVFYGFIFIKTGFYFPFYNRIDATQIMSACRMFRKERSKHLIEIEQEREWIEHLKNLEIKVKNESKVIKLSLLSKRKKRLRKTKP